MDFIEKAKRKFCYTKRYENSEKYYKTTLGMPRFCLFVFSIAKYGQLSLNNSARLLILLIQGFDPSR